jgi:hypothetical protein
MPPGDGEVGGDGQLLSGPGPEQGTVVADPQAQTGARVGRPAADLLQQQEFPR